MPPRINIVMSRAIMLLACLILIAPAARALPTWIGVNGSVQRQTGGNPGTFTVLMNQYYPTLHASVAISVNGSGWKEYPMVYDGMTQKNSKWIYTPAALFPSAAVVKYYFRGWDDAGGSISDGTAAASYSFSATAVSVIPAPGDVDLFGSTISMGSWLDDLNRPIVYLIASDTGTLSQFHFSASRPAHEWIWDRSIVSSPIITMRLDALNRLTLFDAAVVGREGIVLDPSGPQAGIFINGQRVLTATSAAGSYLPLNPVQLTIGVNNTAGADALAVGSSAQATGQNAAAVGWNTTASGENSVAVGDHVTAQGFGQFIAGAYNIPQGNRSISNDTDALFVVGNGRDEMHRSNAVTVLRNGNIGIGTASPSAKLDVTGHVKIDGNMLVTGAVTISPQGDLSMGEFTQGPTP